MSDNRPQRGAKPSLLSSLGSSIGRFSFSRGRSPHVTPPPAFSTPSPSPSPSSASPLPLPASASESTAAVSVTRASLAVVPATAAASTAAAAAPSDVVALGERQAVREPAGSGPACVVATAGKIIGLNGTSGTVTTEGRSVESTAQSGSLDHDSTADAREGITEGRSHILQHLPSSHPTSTSPHRNAPPLPLIPPSEPSYLPNNPPSPIPPTLPSHTTIPASLPSPHPSPLHSSLPPPSPHPSSSSRSSHPSPPESSFPPYSPSAAASISPSVSAATATGAAAISAGGMGLRGYAIAGQVAGANPAAAAAAAAAATANSDANPEASPEANTEASIGASTGCVGWEGGSAADSISPVGSARSIGWEAGGGITAAGNASPAGSMGSMGSMRSVGWEGELMSAAWSGEAGQAWVGERPVWEMKLRNVVLKKEIAKGSSGTVYKGKYKDCPVAVRVVPWSEVEGEMSEGEQWEQRRAKFLREVTIWRRLKHPNIVKFIGASIPEHPQLPSNPTSTGSSSTASTNNGRDDRKDKEKGADLRFKGHAFCVVMEHVEHCSLKEYLFQAARERRKLPMPFIVQVAFDLAKGGACVLGTIHNSSLTPLLASPLPASSPPASLAYLHSMGVVHGDICPENLLLDSKRRLKIARFGAAHVESSHPVSTSTGSCRRTLSYSAPEVLFSQPYDRSADVYSFGICLWELYAREAPFPNLDFGEVADAVKEGARPIISPKCPPDLANVMRCCWEGLPTARPPMPQVIAMLKKVNVFA
ncbi:unnamed protein product, partial [Closterium sp. NIES-54]